MKSLLVLSLLTAPAVVLLALGHAVAGPPEQVLGKMVFDEVAEGLRHYRRETDEAKRAECLKRLAPTRDPRVAVELWEVFAWVRGKRTATIRQVARDCLADYFVPGEGRSRPEVKRSDEERASAVCSWWSRSGAELRRRASQLPR
jgi:hypothetical protein